MYYRGCFPDPVTFTFLFAACSALSSPRLGKMIHAHFILSGFNFDVFASTALVDMYAKLGFVELAQAETLFRLIRSKNVVSWTTMISGYSQNGQYVNALNTFLSMEKEQGLEPNEVSIASVLPACANLGALEVGERIETYARRKGYMNNLFVSNTLLEMYSKCGKLDKAKQLFNEVRDRKNLCSWNSMMMGFAVHGKHEEALDLFRLMLREGMMPDAITIVAALLACTHGGKIAIGREMFESMEDKFGIIPKLEHYGCMVDLLGRKGKLNEAYNLIQTMPMKPDSVIWGTLLGACSFHSNVEVAEKAAAVLFELEPWNSGNYVILSNIYASVNKWDKVAKLRKMMKGSQITKVAGYSCIEEEDQIHMFIVEDKSHPRTNQIYEILEDVYCKIMKSYNGDESDLDAQ
ncbi:hypothetical protein RDABS01_009241 [Bienertia sinuspersici]